MTFEIERVRVERDVPVMAVGDNLDALMDDCLSQVLDATAKHHLVVTTATVDRLETGGVQGAIGGYRRTGTAAARFLPRRAGIQNAIVDVPAGHWVRILIES